MPIIPNFPEALLEEHRRWHHARRSVDLDNPPIGFGLDFLTFHRAFVRKVLDWYYAAGLDPRLVEPWPSVPEPIREARCYNLNAEARILQRPETFASADELGRFIEASNLHGCIHEVAAELYGDPDLDDLDLAPRNTVFYNIHLMIDNWWRNWEGLGRFKEGLSYWSGRFVESESEVLHYRREDSTWWLGSPEPFVRLGSPARAESRDGGSPLFGDVTEAIAGRAGGAAAGGLADAAIVNASEATIGSASEATAGNASEAAAGDAYDAAIDGPTGLYLDWGAVGESAVFGKLDDGRPFRVWDSDRDGRLEILFRSPFTGDWWEGSLRSGRLVWSQIRVQRTGLPSQERDPLREASSRRKRKTPR